MLQTVDKGKYSDMTIRELKAARKEINKELHLARKRAVAFIAEIRAKAREQATGAG